MEARSIGRRHRPEMPVCQYVHCSECKTEARYCQRAGGGWPKSTDGMSIGGYISNMRGILAYRQVSRCSTAMRFAKLLTSKKTFRLQEVQRNQPSPDYLSRTWQSVWTSLSAGVSWLPAVVPQRRTVYWRFSYTPRRTSRPSTSSTDWPGALWAVDGALCWSHSSRLTIYSTPN